VSASHATLAPSVSQSMAASAEPSPSPSPAPASAPAAQPAPDEQPVGFSGLPSGTYPVHLHTICNGRQSFHIAVLGSLVVGPAGSGAIEVQSGYFGQGWCVIVYSSGSLVAVLATRPI